MKKLIYFVVFAMCCSCDPEECSSYYINNKTHQKITLNYISKTPDYNKEIFIDTSSKAVFSGKTCALGGISLELDADSIYLSNDTNEILNVWKPDTPGKNIYNIDKYWTVRETSKNHFVYTYEITNDDLIIEKRKKSIK